LAAIIAAVGKGATREFPQYFTTHHRACHTDSHRRLLDKSRINLNGGFFQQAGMAGRRTQRLR
jgi:hypothetical protein